MTSEANNQPLVPSWHLQLWRKHWCQIICAPAKITCNITGETKTKNYKFKIITGQRGKKVFPVVPFSVWSISYAALVIRSATVHCAKLTRKFSSWIKFQRLSLLARLPQNFHSVTSEPHSSWHDAPDWPFLDTATTTMLIFHLKKKNCTSISLGQQDITHMLFFLDGRLDACQWSHVTVCFVSPWWSQGPPWRTW